MPMSLHVSKKLCIYVYTYCVGFASEALVSMSLHVSKSISVYMYIHIVYKLGGLGYTTKLPAFLVLEWFLCPQFVLKSLP